MKSYLLIFVLAFLTSCTKTYEPETPEQLFERYKGSVVLITNQYYYEINTNGLTFYYSPGSEKKIFTEKSELLSNLSISTGTGFIISTDGQILTNRHVVSPVDDSYKAELFILKQKEMDEYSMKIDNYNDTIANIESYYYNYSSYMSGEEKYKLEDKYSNLKKDREINQVNLNFLQNLDFTYSTIKVVSQNIAVAFNNTYVTDMDDLQECVIIKESGKDNIDLALIQTKTKNFNIPPQAIFNFEDNNPNIVENPEKIKPRNIKDPIKINSDVFMIGYNKGFSLANTKQGIKSQFTSGKISQESDGERILYTIPTLEGSSGSPIIDKWGNLVGVNFAKISNSQNFSFGIPVYEVKKFFEE